MKHLNIKVLDPRATTDAPACVDELVLSFQETDCVHCQAMATEFLRAKAERENSEASDVMTGDIRGFEVESDHEPWDVVLQRDPNAGKNPKPGQVPAPRARRATKP